MRLIVALCMLAATMLLLLGFLGRWFAFADALSQFRHLLFVVVGLGSFVTAGLSLRWQTILARLTLAFALIMTFPFLPFMGPAEEGSGALRLVQFNVRIHNERDDEAADWILAQNPDVLMLQEYLDETQPALKKLWTTLPHGIHCKSSKLGEVVVRSRFPILTSRCVDGEGLAWAQLDVNGKKLTFATVHLHWPWPFRQWQHLEDLAPSFAEMPEPVVLAGDHNAAPWSEALRQVERLTGSQLIPGFRITHGLDFLHNNRELPLFAIDHVLLPEGAEAKKIAVGPDIGSDHWPVIVEFDPP